MSWLSDCTVGADVNEPVGAMCLKTPPTSRPPCVLTLSSLITVSAEETPSLVRVRLSRFCCAWSRMDELVLLLADEKACAC